MKLDYETTRTCIHLHQKTVYCHIHVVKSVTENKMFFVKKARYERCILLLRMFVTVYKICRVVKVKRRLDEVVSSILVFAEDLFV